MPLRCRTTRDVALEQLPNMRSVAMTLRHPSGCHRAGFNAVRDGTNRGLSSTDRLVRFVQSADEEAVSRIASVATRMMRGLRHDLAADSEAALQQRAARCPS